MIFTLDTVIRNFQYESGYSSQHNYGRLLQISIAGLRELNLDISGIPAIYNLPVNANYTVDLPPGFISYTRIAICRSGYKVDLGLNNDICDRTISDCGEIEAPVVVNPSDAGGWWWGDDGQHSRNGETIGRFFGIGGGNSVHGYYRVDESKGIILLNDTTATEIILECLVDIQLVNGEFIVHPFIVEALKSWMYWKMIQRDRNYGLGEKEMAERDWLKNKVLANRRFLSSTWSEWLSSMRRSNQAAPKF